MSSQDRIDLRSLTRERDAALSRSAGTEVPFPRRRWKTRVLLPGGIVLATIGILGFSARDLLLPVTDVRVAPLVAKSGGPGRSTSSAVVQAPGWVEADPYAIAVSALADGIVEEVLVLEGDRVETGQIVTRMVDDDARIALALAEGRLAESRAHVGFAQAALEEARQNWEHPIELRRACDVLAARLAESQAALDRWPAELASEEAAAISLKADLDRVTPLHERGQASEIEFVHARQAYEVQKANAEQVRLREPMLAAQLVAHRAELTAARRHLELRIVDTRAVKQAEAAVQQAEAAVATAQAVRDDAALRLARMEVRSPASGIVLTRLVEPGSKLMKSMDNPQSAQAVRLYDPKKLQVRVDIPLVDASKIGVGQPAELIVGVLPDRVFSGRVSRIVHEADIQKNTLQVKVAIDDPIAELKPEMLARAKFLEVTGIGQTDDGPSRMILAPKRAVHEDPNGTFVWIADQSDGVARRRVVKPGSETADGYIELRDGGRMGDRVIVDAPANLVEGQRIRVVGEGKEAGDGAD